MAKNKSARAAAPRVRDLTRELGVFLEKTLLPDLTTRAKDPAVRAALEREHADEQRTHRTADKLEAWIPKTLEQIGVAWLVSCVFIRTLEDRGLLVQARLAGDGATDSQALFAELFPALSDRDYLLTLFREVAKAPGTEDLLGPAKNPAWKLAPSGPAVREMLALFRETEGDGALVFRFDETARPGTRFLGDLYQDISAGVRERYALLQTPEFVEELILDQTLAPAIDTFGLDAVRVLDPTCGSGHFLLGAFQRLLDAHRRDKPALDAKSHANLALAQVYGVDVNPYAVAIARFRLVLAYLQAAGVDRLSDSPAIHPRLVVGDSLLLGVRDVGRTFAELDGQAEAWGNELFSFEDRREAEAILTAGFHAVVGNPPYITCKDAELREAYRKRYVSAVRQFALAAPFTERFFQLAIEGGFIGMINANSFMKREFGKRLIEDVLPRYELTRVVDTSGAYIPGHGTPTVLLFGRNRRPVAATIKAVLGKRGEPATPADPVKGLVWSSLAQHLDDMGFQNEFLSVAEVARETFETHPWSLGGGGASELKVALEERADSRLGTFILEIGRSTHTGEDEAFFMPRASIHRLGIPQERSVPLVKGEQVRDWILTEDESCIFPYDLRTAEAREPSNRRELAYFWNLRTILRNRMDFGKHIEERGLRWFEHSMFFPSRFLSPLSIAFAFVATHNHFALDRGGKVFKQSAPVITLPPDATEDHHLALLAYLNSSTAAFFFRQVGHSKGAQGVNEGHKSETWEQFLEYSGALVESVPLPKDWRSLAALGRKMDELATERAAVSAAESVRSGNVDDATQRDDALLREMVATQEKIDFEVYRLWNLIDRVPNIAQAMAPGSRFFEQALASSGMSTRWFSANSYQLPELGREPTDFPALPSEVRLIEQPEYKRRWTRRDRTAETQQAARTILAELVEAEAKRSLQPASGRRLADSVERKSVARRLDKALMIRDEELRATLLDVICDNAVPFLAALRYTDSGLEKRAAWEATWTLQRREDAGEAVDIPVPPKYDSKDYRDPTIWRLRGKLDVPKERFISYPGAETDDDPSPIFGWAGWDHLEQARALTTLYVERKDADGWGASDDGRARLVPLLAALLELQPWLLQWHDVPHPDFGGEGPGSWYARYIEGEARAIGRTLDDLRGWKPAKGRRQR